MECVCALICIGHGGSYSPSRIAGLSCECDRRPDCSCSGTEKAMHTPHPAAKTKMRLEQGDHSGKDQWGIDHSWNNLPDEKSGPLKSSIIVTEIEDAVINFYNFTLRRKSEDRQRINSWLKISA